MKSPTLSIALALAAGLMLSACAPGRYTGGGNLSSQGTLLGTFTLNNIAAADCFDANDLPGQDGIADTFRGEARWRGVSGESFTCEVTSGGTSGPGGNGQFFGTITHASGNLNGATTGNTCLVIVVPNVKGVSLTANGGSTYAVGGTVDAGNVSFHKENTSGICASR